MTMSDSARANPLLWGLILISAAIHLLLFLKIAAMTRPAVPVYIELDLRSVAEPVLREIPRPLYLPETGERLSEMDISNIAEEALRPEHIGPLPTAEAPSALQRYERIPIPEIAELRDTDIAVWEGNTGEASPFPNESESGVRSDPLEEAAYLQRLNREKIPLIHAEALKRYNQKARRKRIQGRTVIRVILDSSGAIVEAVVAESSNHASLDEIALKAVKIASPFPPPPNRRAALDIPITFKL